MGVKTNSSHEQDIRPPKITLATEAHTLKLIELYNDALLKKQRFGDDSWGQEPFTEQEVAGIQASGSLYVVEQDGELLGAMLVSEQDERVWPEASIGEALYLNKIVTSSSASGQGLADRLIQYAEELARTQGVGELRLDCILGNGRLIRYYEDRGFMFDSTLKVREDFTSYKMKRPIVS